MKKLSKEMDALIDKIITERLAERVKTGKIKDKDLPKFYKQKVTAKVSEKQE